MLIHTVSDVARYLRELLDSDLLLADLWVSGEVSNVSRSSLGHLYFTLKDKQAQLRCVLFRGNQGPVELQQGAAVIVHGRVSFYEGRGDLQLIADLVQPEGVGVLHLQFQQLKAKLEAEGLFDPARKRPLPPFPRHIGVVTSPTGAVLHDIINVMGRRYPLAELVLAPTLVQGEGAAENIVAALASLNAQEDMDVIIVARGGGSLEELWPFNEERVARAIYGSRVPVVTGVGHETDVTLAQLVADLGAATPSAAAEQVVPDVAELRLQIAAHRRTLAAATADLLAERHRDLQAITHRLRRALPDLDRLRQSLDDLARGALHALKGLLALEQERVRSRRQQLQSLNPLSTLARGYAIVQREGSGEVVSRSRQVARGDALKVQVSDGSFGARVTRPSRAKAPELGLQPAMAELLAAATSPTPGPPEADQEALE